jgi:MFS family permease
MSAARALLGGRTFRSLREHRNYRLWFSAQVVSVSGTWMQNTAQAWLVLQLTGSPQAVGALVAFQFGPYALLGLAGGVLSDRMDRRRALLITQSLPILFAGTLAVLAATHQATVGQIYTLAALNGLVQVLDTPARQAFTVEMVGRDELPNAIALNSSIFNASRIIGPGLAGIIIGIAGVAVCFALNALSYLAVVAALLLMRRADLFAVKTGRPPMLRGLVDGLCYAARTPRVRLVLLMMLVIGTISINFSVWLPVMAKVTLQGGPQTLGLLSASFGVGALGGALVSASLGRADVRAVILGAAGLGLTEILLAPLTSVAATAILLVASGLFFTTYTANSNSTIQITVPDRLRGRVIAMYAYFFFGTAPVGGYFSGWLAERGGTALALGVAGGTAVVSAGLGALWWAHERRAVRPQRAVAQSAERDRVTAH